MILLKGQTLEKKDRIRVETMQLNLEERNSSATITVGPDAPEIPINSWLQDDTEPGQGIVWRVKSVRTQAETQTRTISLEHVIQYLRDELIFGEAKPRDMGGGSSGKCSARQAAIYALGKQSKSIWKLGEMFSNPTNPYSFNGDSIYAALETITGSIDGAQWEYDLSSVPFTLHIRKHPTGFQSEMRMRRNVQTLSIQVDRTRMYTRHYPIGKNNLHIDGNYTTQGAGTWGVIAKVETDQSLDTKEKLKAWSLERLQRHCEPLVTVTIGGIELSEDTGESLDHIVIGRNCRLPLPEYGTEMTERVTKISWADKIKEPKKMTVTLANQQEDVASIINSQSSSSGRSGRAGAKQAEEDHAWFVDTTTHVAMVAEAVAGPGAGTDWSRVASVVVDGEGIHQRVVRTEGEVVSMWATIDVLEDKIVLEVANAKSDTYSKIEQTASHIRSEVSSSKSSLFSTIMQTATMIYTQVGNAKSDTYSKIEQTASSIRSEVNSSKSSLWSSIVQTSTAITQKVGKGEVISSINQTAETITINASRINLEGYVTATNLSALIAELPNIEGISASFSGTVSAAGLIGNAVYVRDGNANKDISGAILSLQITRDGNDYTLQKKSAQDLTWKDVGTFSRAVASWEMGWSNGTFTAKAKPQNQSITTQIVQGTTSRSGGTFTIPIEAIDSDNPGYQYATGRNVSLSLSTMSLTRAPAYRNASGYQYYGRLYYYDNTTSTYKAASDSDHYWYYSGTNRSGTNTVFY